MKAEPHQGSGVSIHNTTVSSGLVCVISRLITTTQIFYVLGGEVFIQQVAPPLIFDMNKAVALPV